MIIFMVCCLGIAAQRPRTTTHSSSSGLSQSDVLFPCISHTHDIAETLHARGSIYCCCDTHDGPRQDLYSVLNTKTSHASIFLLAHASDKICRPVALRNITARKKKDNRHNLSPSAYTRRQHMYNILQSATRSRSIGQLKARLSRRFCGKSKLRGFAPSH